MYESQTTRRLSHARVASLSRGCCAASSDGHGEAPLQQSNTDPVTDALYTINFAALGLREAVAATQNSTLAAAEAKLSQYLTRIQQRSASRPELDGAWMRAAPGPCRGSSSVSSASASSCCGWQLQRLRRQPPPAAWSAVLVSSLQISQSTR